MSETLKHIPFRDLGDAKLVRPLEVMSGLKNVAILLEYELDGKTRLGLYRSERIIRVSPDDRVPVPQELYRDVAFHRLDRKLNWHISLPVAPWSIKPRDNGVLRPYLPDAHIEQAYFYENQENLECDLFWVQLAVMDYITGVIDRNAGDILFQQQNKYAIDSGLSFVEGDEFVVQHSVVRDALRGTLLPFSLLHAIELVNQGDLESQFGDLLSADSVYWLRRRIENTLNTGEVL